jgi:hypothetical protein
MHAEDVIVVHVGVFVSHASSLTSFLL